MARYFCYSCPLGCGGISLAPDGSTEVHRPEYESTIALGGLCLNEDADSIYYLYEPLNRAGVCLFGAFLGAHRIPVFDWLNAATGWDVSPEDYLTIGHRIQTVKQLFNIRQGIAPADIRISRRVLGDPPQSAGANRGRTVPLLKNKRDCIACAFCRPSCLVDAIAMSE